MLRLVVHCLPPSLDIFKLAVERLKTRYINSTDINLRCIGLSLLAETVEISDVSLALVVSTFKNGILEEVSDTCHEISMRV